MKQLKPRLSAFPAVLTEGVEEKDKVVAMESDPVRGAVQVVKLGLEQSWWKGTFFPGQTPWKGLKLRLPFVVEGHGAGQGTVKEQM